MVKRISGIVAAVMLAMVTGACSGGAAGNIGGGVTPSQVGTGSGTFQPRAQGDENGAGTPVVFVPNPRYSCPTTEIPTGLSAAVSQGGIVTLAWKPSAGINSYQVTVQFYNVTNSWVTVKQAIAQPKTIDAGGFVHYDYKLPVEGRYKAQLRTRACGDAFGPTSDWVEFSN